MLEGEWPSRREESAIYGPAPEPASVEPRLRALQQAICEPEDRAERRVIQPRRVVATALILVGVVWALVRGLDFYGVSPVDVVYDLDQPPLLLIIVAGWLWFRSRAR